MAESYGYFDYGDVKDLIINYNPSQGFIIKDNKEKISTSKNATVYKTVDAKNEDEIKYVVSSSKHILCHSPSINKSVNNQYYWMDEPTIEKVSSSNISNNEFVLDTEKIGYYSYETTGQVANHTLTIIPTPTESKIKINGVETNTHIGFEYIDVDYEVSCDNYATKTGTITLLDDTELNIDLIPAVTLTIEPDQENAVVYMNGLETNQFTVGQGESITYEVYCDGYIDIEETIVVDEDIVMPIHMIAHGLYDKSVGNYTTWVIQKDNSLWGCGRSSDGQQGSGSTSDVTTFTKRLDDVKCVRTDYYAYTTWAIKNDNTLWGCGRGDENQQANGGTSDVTTFTKRMSDVKEVYPTYHHILVLKTDNSLWGVGQNTNGQLGLSSTSNKSSFTKIMDDVHQVAVAPGISMVIKKDGTLWGAGKLTEGNMGVGSSSGNYTSFKQIMTDVKSIALTNFTAWVIKTDNSLWGSGYNSDGEQGNGTTTKVTTFTKVMDDVRCVKACNYSTWVLKRDNTLWGTGQGSNGQQGSGDVANVLTFTQRLDNVKYMDICSVYGYTTWAIKNDNTLWGCGMNDYGQQGDGTTTDVTVFTQRAENVKYVQASSYCTWYIDTNDNLYGCGYNSDGQQGSGDKVNVTTFTKRMENVRW